MSASFKIGHIQTVKEFVEKQNKLYCPIHFWPLHKTHCFPHRIAQGLHNNFALLQLAKQYRYLCCKIDPHLRETCKIQVLILELWYNGQSWSGNVGPAVLVEVTQV